MEQVLATDKKTDGKKVIEAKGLDNKFVAGKLTDIYKGILENK